MKKGGRKMNDKGLMSAILLLVIFFSILVLLFSFSPMVADLNSHATKVVTGMKKV